VVALSLWRRLTVTHHLLRRRMVDWWPSPSLRELDELLPKGLLLDEPLLKVLLLKVLLLKELLLKELLLVNLLLMDLLLMDLLLVDLLLGNLLMQSMTRVAVDVLLLLIINMSI
jgi:hypothetical protein